MEPLNLKLQMVLNDYVSAGGLVPGPLEETQCSLALSQLSSQSQDIYIYIYIFIRAMVKKKLKPISNRKIQDLYSQDDLQCVPQDSDPCLWRLRHAEYSLLVPYRSLHCLQQARAGKSTLGEEWPAGLSLGQCSSSSCPQTRLFLSSCHEMTSSKFCSFFPARHYAT